MTAHTKPQVSLTQQGNTDHFIVSFDLPGVDFTESSLRRISDLIELRRMWQQKKNVASSENFLRKKKELFVPP